MRTVKQQRKRRADSRPHKPNRYPKWWGREDLPAGYLTGGWWIRTIPARKLRR